MSTYLIPGEKVHFCPKPEHFVQMKENGIIHSVHPNPFKRYVVFYSPKGWDHYLEEKPQEMFLEYLKPGWVELHTN